MKTLNIPLEDREYAHLAALKQSFGSISWRRFILEIADYEEQTGDHKPKRTKR